MNTKQITRTATFFATAIMAASVSATAPAFAEHAVDDGGAGQVTSWTVPFDAIGGRTMAQYVADHQAAYFPGAQS